MNGYRFVTHINGVLGTCLCVHGALYDGWIGGAINLFIGALVIVGALKRLEP